VQRLLGHFTTREAIWGGADLSLQVTSADLRPEASRTADCPLGSGFRSAALREMW
jgi:hypothetical protein